MRAPGSKIEWAGYLLTIYGFVAMAWKILTEISDVVAVYELFGKASPVLKYWNDPRVYSGATLIGLILIWLDHRLRPVAKRADKPDRPKIEWIEVARNLVDEPSSMDQYFTFGKSRMALEAILASFRLAASSLASGARVSARIDFAKEDGKVLERADCAMWIGHPESQAFIRKADTFYLLIALRDRQQKWVAVDNNHVQLGIVTKPLPIPCYAWIQLLIDDEPEIFGEVQIPGNT